MPRRKARAGDPVEPGARLPEEPLARYRLFCLYRDLPPPRSLPKVAVAARLSYTTIRRVAADYRWEARVEEWDAVLEENRRRARLNDITAMEQRQLDLAHTLQNKAVEKLAKTPVSKLKPIDVMRFARLGFELERQVLKPEEAAAAASADRVTFTITMGEPLGRGEALPRLAPGMRGISDDDVIDDADAIDAEYTADDDPD